MQPLAAWDILRYFDPRLIITYDDVIKAESETGVKPLSKPHPYTFIKGMLGRDFGDAKIITGDYPKNLISKTLAIGDTASDITAAKSAGMDFLAVLTGVEGTAAREFFENNGADYILNDLGEIIDPDDE